MKNIAAALAASSLLLASAPAAASAASLSVSSVERAAPAAEESSELMDSGFIGFALVFGLGAIAGALLYSVIKGGDEEPVSP